MVKDLMCGIAGLMTSGNQLVSREEVKAMTDMMIERGPDDEGFFVYKNVAIGMRRLSIIDVGGGQQPITNEDQTLWVVMNGEIYNYIELRAELEDKGHCFSSGSDTEVLVHGYEETGCEFVKELNGMFAFALYDTKRQGLWLGRDRLGIKPMYYVEANGRFLFSSDLDTFPAEFRQTISPESLLAYFGQGYIPTPLTIYRDIKKIPPGYWLWIENGQESKRELYWQLTNFQTAEMSRSNAGATLHHLLKSSIALQLRSDVPLGVMLSGGVDSSAVTALAASTISNPLNTFSIHFSQKGGEDAKYARQVAAYYHTNHQTIDLTSDDLLQSLPEVIEFFDEPIADSALVPTYCIAKFAQEKGIKVMLSGAGGDELFGGYGRHYRPRFASPSWVAEQLPKFISKVIGQWWSIFQPHRGFRAQDSGLAYLSSVFGADLGFFKQTLLSEEHFLQLLQTLCTAASPIIDRQNVLGYTYSRMYFDLQHYLLDNILALTDKATMAASVEGRVPLLDHRIVELAFSLPAHINLWQGRPKGLLKDSLSPYLSANLLERKKEGFNAPIAVWMGENFFSVISNELKENLSPVLRDFFNQPSLLRYLRTEPRQPFLASTLFSLYVLNYWLRTHSL